MKTKNTAKTIYEVDPFNRLIYAKRSKPSLIPKFRKVLDGRFSTSENGSLIYHIKKPADSKGPEQIKLSGEYSLDKNHNLVLTLDSVCGRIGGNKLEMKSEIIGAEANRILFAVTTKDSSGKFTGYILELEGTWQADKYNRLSFNIKKERGAINTLTLQGEWNINKQNQIIYTYTKESLKTKEKLTQSLTFKGYWDITEKHRLLYVLNKDLASQFDFKVSLGEGLARGLRYEIGLGLRPIKKEITLFGRWKINERLEFEFEIQYEKNRIEYIIFGGTCMLTEKDTFEFKLKNKEGKDLGLNLKLSRKILKDQGEIFLRGLLSRKEIETALGAGWRW